MQQGIAAAWLVVSEGASSQGDSGELRGGCWVSSGVLPL